MSNPDHRPRIRDRICDQFLILTEGIARVACRILPTDLGFNTEPRTQSGDQILIITPGIAKFARRILTTDLGFETESTTRFSSFYVVNNQGCISNLDNRPRIRDRIYDKILILTPGIATVACRILTTDLRFNTEPRTQSGGTWMKQLLQVESGCV